jgi:hypothetical protein
MTEACGDGLDNDGDGAIDENCVCDTGHTQSCYGGAQEWAGVGQCSLGTQRCTGVEFGEWGACEGWTAPTADLCDGLDNDCDGTTDEDCACVPGDTQPCYGGPAEQAGVGQCALGTQTCTDDGSGEWGACQGWTASSPDVCDGLDNDCDGTADENCICDPGATRSCSSDFSSQPHLFSCGEGEATCVGNLSGSHWGSCDGETVCETVEDEFTYGETTGSRPVDIVLVVDQSGSMGGEIENVRNNLNAYSSALEASGIDYNVILIAERGTGGHDICIPPPLGGPSCSDTARFHQIDRRVGSHNALQRIEDHITTVESHMRSGSLRVFTVVTDDDSRMSANEFETFLAGRSGYDDYIFDGIIGEHHVCEGTADDGLVYIELASRTGGQIEHICEPDWSASFDRFADEIISRTVRYTLTRTPSDVTPLRVFFVEPDGTEVEQPEGTAWHYEASSNAIVIHDGYTPADGTPIRARYAVEV